MIKITEWKSNVANLAKTNRFLIELNIVTRGQEKDPFSAWPTDFEQKMKYLVQDAIIPNRIQNNITVKYHGMRLEVPGDYEHSDLTIKFLNNSDWECRKFFETWQNLIQYTFSNVRTNSIDILNLAKIKVIQLGLDENDVLNTYNFYNVYPKEVSDIKLSMGSNEFETFDVTFAYSHWD